PVGAIKLARPTFTFQPGLLDQSALICLRTYALARGVDVPRPRIGRGHLESTGKPAIEAPLHGVIGGIAVAGANLPRTKVRMKTYSVWLLRVDLLPSSKFVALRPDVRTIKDQIVRKLPLNTKPPPLPSLFSTIFL